MVRRNQVHALHSHFSAGWIRGPLSSRPSDFAECCVFPSRRPRFSLTITAHAQPPLCLFAHHMFWAIASAMAVARYTYEIQWQQQHVAAVAARPRPRPAVRVRGVQINKLPTALLSESEPDGRAAYRSIAQVRVQQATGSTLNDRRRIIVSRQAS